MKIKIIMIITIMMCASTVFAVEGKIDLNKIAEIESSHNPNAYNKSSRATGLHQITPICLTDYNQYHQGKYTMTEMFEPEKNKIVAEWYIKNRIPQLLKYYKKPITIENILVSYNCGISCVGKPLPVETKNYIKKYNRE